jgi:hypothetical protein
MIASSEDSTIAAQSQYRVLILLSFGDVPEDGCGNQSDSPPSKPGTKYNYQRKEQEGRPWLDDPP